MQDDLASMFPGLAPNNKKMEGIKNVENVRSDKGSPEEHRYDFY